MKLIIAGSRNIEPTINDIEAMLEGCVDLGIFPDEPISLIISGGCRGTDRSGEDYANEHGIEISYHFPGDPSDPASYHIRNGSMAKEGDHALLIFSEGSNKGTNSMLAKAKSEGVVVAKFLYVSRGVYEIIADKQTSLF